MGLIDKMRSLRTRGDSTHPGSGLIEYDDAVVMVARALGDFTHHPRCIDCDHRSENHRCGIFNTSVNDDWYCSFNSILDLKK